MSSNQVIPRNQLCFDKFEGVEYQFKMILNLVKKARFYEALSTDIRIFSKKVEEFYLNGSFVGEIKSKVEDVTLSYDPKEIGKFVNEGDTGFGGVNTKKGLEFIGFKKKNQKLKDTKEGLPIGLGVSS